MRRRAFIAGLGGAVAWPLAAGRNSGRRCRWSDIFILVCLRRAHIS